MLWQNFEAQNPQQQQQQHVMYQQQQQQQLLLQQKQQEEYLQQQQQQRIIAQQSHSNSISPQVFAAKASASTSACYSQQTEVQPNIAHQRRDPSSAAPHSNWANPSPHDLFQTTYPDPFQCGVVGAIPGGGGGGVKEGRVVKSQASHIPCARSVHSGLSSELSQATFKDNHVSYNVLSPVNACKT